MDSARAKALQFLKSHSLAALATVANDNVPHVASVYYVVDDELNIYCVSREGTRKFQNIKQNPNVSLVITDEETAETVQLTGRADTGLEGEEESKVLERLWRVTVEKTSWPAPVVKINKGGISVVRIRPSELVFGDFKPIHLDDDKDYFQKVI